MWRGKKVKIAATGWRVCARGAIAGFVFGVAALFGADASQAEMQISVYGGWNGSLDSDVDLKQPGGTDMTLSDVPWEGLSFTTSGGPPYYGFRALYWFDAKPNWGVGVDYNHSKARAEADASVAVSGTRDGAPVGGRETVGTTFDLLEFTDGLNLLFATLFYRIPGERFTPYAGIGVGVALPHVEVSRVGDPTRTFEYQLTGAAVEALAGVEMRLTDRLGWFGEYKISYAQVDGDLEGGGSIETDMWTNHVITGLTFHFQPPPMR